MGGGGWVGEGWGGWVRHQGARCGITANPNRFSSLPLSAAQWDWSRQNLYTYLTRPSRMASPQNEFTFQQTEGESALALISLHCSATPPPHLHPAGQTDRTLGGVWGGMERGMMSELAEETLWFYVSCKWAVCLTMHWRRRNLDIVHRRVCLAEKMVELVQVDITKNDRCDRKVSYRIRSWVSSTKA